MMRILIKGDTEEVSIEVSGYENTDAVGASDANWLSCVIGIEVGSFRGQYSATLTTQDFVCFEKDLSGLLIGEKSEAIFFTYEEWIHLEITVDSLGRGKVVGKASDNSSPRVTLSFIFETDQTFLEQAKISLRKIITTFPVKKGNQ